MKEIIPKDTRYVPLTQQKSCCVPASISIVMFKHGIKLIPQELLGYHLGLIVDKQFKNLFWNVSTGKRPKSGYGTRMDNKKYDMNNAFKKLKIPLKANYILIKKIKTKKEFVLYIEEKIKKDKDIIVCFNSGVLNDNKKAGGHLSVIDRIYPKRNIVRIIDPSYNQPKWREVDIDKLKKAMELHPTKGGFWELEKI
jgi:hypothetical protein